MKNLHLTHAWRRAYLLIYHGKGLASRTMKILTEKNSSLPEYFHSAIEQEVWKTTDKICSFIVTSSAAISGSRLDDSSKCNTAN